jgi:hypothetical protein
VTTSFLFFLYCIIWKDEGIKYMDL